MTWVARVLMEVQVVLVVDQSKEVGWVLIHYSVVLLLVHRLRPVEQLCSSCRPGRTRCPAMHLGPLAELEDGVGGAACRGAADCNSSVSTVRSISSASNDPLQCPTLSPVLEAGLILLLSWLTMSTLRWRRRTRRIQPITLS